MLGEFICKTALVFKELVQKDQYLFGEYVINHLEAQDSRS